MRRKLMPMDSTSQNIDIDSRISRLHMSTSPSSTSGGNAAQAHGCSPARRPKWTRHAHGTRTLHRLGAPHQREKTLKNPPGGSTNTKPIRPPGQPQGNTHKV